MRSAEIVSTSRKRVSYHKHFDLIKPFDKQLSAMGISAIMNTNPTLYIRCRNTNPQSRNVGCVSSLAVHSVFQTAKSRAPIRSTHLPSNQLPSLFHGRYVPPHFSYDENITIRHSGSSQADSFQSDLYPPVPSTEPSLSAAEYFNGKEPTLNLVSIANGAFVTTATSANTFAAQPLTPISQAPTLAPIQPTRSYSAAAPSPASAPAPFVNPSLVASLSETVATPTSIFSPSERRLPDRSEPSDSKVCKYFPRQSSLCSLC